MYDLFWDVELLCRDNEEIDAGEESTEEIDTGEEDGGQPAGKPNGKPNGKVFTQKEVDEIVVKRNKNLQKQYQHLQDSLEKLKENKNLTDREKAELEEQLESVRNSQLSAEERLKKEKQKTEEKYKTELDEARKERDKFKNLHEQSTIKRSLSDEAVKHEAYSPMQIVELLQGRTTLTASEEDPDEMVPIIDWLEKTSEGKVLRVQKSPAEVIEYMKDSDDYANLFRSNIAQGVGGGTGTPKNMPGKVDPTKISTERYMELRKTPEGRRALGLA